MHRSLKLARRLALIPPLVLLALVFATHSLAQGYVDITNDDENVYVDFYDDAPAGTGSCPHYIVIDVHLVNAAASAEAYYPNTAHAHVQSPFTPGVSMFLQREIITFATQRGGNCGAIADVQFSSYPLVAVTYTVATTLLSTATGWCPQGNNCSNTTTPLCPVTRILEGAGQEVTCHLYHVTYKVYYNGSCKIGISDVTETGTGGICTPAN